MKNRPATTQMPIIAVLPDDLCTRIGQIVTLWAYVEWETLAIMYLVLGINPKVGRFSVAEPRVADQLERIAKILSMYGTEHDAKRLKTLIPRARMLKERRDAFGHGVWMFDPDTKTLGLRRTTGNDEGTGLSNKLWPSREPWTPLHMHYLVAAFRNFAAEINAYRGHLIEVLGPAPATPQRPFPNHQTPAPQPQTAPE